MKRPPTLYIKNPAAHRLAKQLAKRMGVTITEAVIRALEDKSRQAPITVDRKKLDQILARFDALPVLDPRTPDQILGYDQFGLPR